MEKHGLVGMVIPDHANPFFSVMAQRIQRELSERGWALLLMSSDGNRARELSLIKTMLEIGIKGLVYVSAGDNAAALDLLDDCGLPVLILDREVPGVKNCDFVVTDNAFGVDLAIRYLHELGHRRIGCLQGALTTVPGRERAKAFSSSCKKLSIDVQNECVFRGDFKFGPGTAAGKALAAMDASKRPTAVFCSNDLMAVALIQALGDLGIRVPEDISVIGFDDIPLASWIRPRLTTIAQDIDEIAVHGVRLLLERAVVMVGGHADSAPRVQLLQPILIERDSCQRPTLQKQGCRA